jgi:outer membrane protein TolC
MRKIIDLKYPDQIILFTIIVILVLVSYSGSILAKEMNPEEAIRWGVENNYDLNTIRNSLLELERNLEILDAAQSFQVDFSVTPIWYFGKNRENSVEVNDNAFSPSTEVSLSATKILSDHINLSTEIAWETDDLMQTDYRKITSEMNANIKLSKQVYPDSWTENEKQVYNIKNSLRMKLEELEWEEMEKQIEFVQGYLNVIRLQEQVILARERVTLARDTLTRIGKQIELGEGGYQQETEAQIALEEAENQLVNQEQGLSLAKKQWFLNLNLPEDTIVYFGDGTDFIQNLFSLMESLKINEIDRLAIIADAQKKHYRIKNSEVELEALVKELEWMEDEGKPKVNLSGGYQYPGDWFAMVDFSVNLADGGAQKLKEQQKKANIQQKEVSIAYLKEQLRLEGEQLIDQDLYNRLYLDTQLLILKKEQHKAEILEKQYQQEAISETQWKNELLALKEKEMNMKKAEDQWFVDRLKLAHFIGYLREEI